MKNMIRNPLAYGIYGGARFPRSNRGPRTGHNFTPQTNKMNARWEAENARRIYNDKQKYYLKLIGILGTFSLLYKAMNAQVKNQQIREEANIELRKSNPEFAILTEANYTEIGLTAGSKAAMPGIELSMKKPNCGPEENSDVKFFLTQQSELQAQKETNRHLEKMMEIKDIEPEKPLNK